jgi:hypothetical protein
LLRRFVSTSDLNLMRSATMLIDHDFDWDGDPEGSPRPAVEAAAAEVPGPFTTPRLPGGSSELSPEIVIIRRRRGFSHGTLALAIVALVLSATLRLSKTRHPNAEPIIERTEIPADCLPHERADPGGWPTDAIRRAPEAGREKPARRDHLREEPESIK